MLDSGFEAETDVLANDFVWHYGFWRSDSRGVGYPQRSLVRHRDDHNRANGVCRGFGRYGSKEQTNEATLAAGSDY
jgi:hypothetical protein